MDALLDFLVSIGNYGMFISAFLAGSVLPFSSELVLTGLFAAGSAPVPLFICASLGNILGSMVNYGIGRLGREEWITKWAKVSPEQLEKGKRKVRRYGFWAGLLAWVPILGSVITVALGFLRVNFFLSTLTISFGKVVRYAILMLAITAAA